MASVQSSDRAAQAVSPANLELPEKSFLGPPTGDVRVRADAAIQPPADSLLTTVKRTLEMIARGASLADILANLCAEIEAQSPDIISSVLLMDPHGDGQAARRTPFEDGQCDSKVRTRSMIGKGVSHAAVTTRSFR